MSRSAKVRLVFDQPRDFRLGIGQLEELQERTDCGPEELFNRIGVGRWRVADIQETLRLGLIGAEAGVGVTEAAVLVSRYAGPGMLLEWKDHARAILYAAMAGAPDEDEPRPGGDDGGDDRLPRSKLRFGRLYGIGAAMGFTPAEVRACSLWDLGQAWAGYRRANGIEDKPRAPTEDEFEAAVARAFDDR